MEDLYHMYLTHVYIPLWIHTTYIYMLRRIPHIILSLQLLCCTPTSTHQSKLQGTSPKSTVVLDGSSCSKPVPVRVTTVPPDKLPSTGEKLWKAAARENRVSINKSKRYTATTEVGTLRSMLNAARVYGAVRSLPNTLATLGTMHSAAANRRARLQAGASIFPPHPCCATPRQ